MTILEVIITDCDHENIEIEKETLENGNKAFLLKQCKTESDLIKECQGAPVWINQYAPVTKNVIENCPDLRLVVRYGVGVNNVDLDAATEHGVQVCNIPDYGTQEVADHALALMLSLTRKINLMNRSVKNGEWDYQKGIPIYRHSEQTIGIIGLGRIGTEFARRVLALGCKVVVYDPNRNENRSHELSNLVEFVSFDQLLVESDVISIHCPLDSARNLISEPEFQKMKPSSYLINVSRGGIIDEGALNRALKNGWIAGAALDVAEKEPISTESPLLLHDNFLCTPHMAWYSEQSAKELKRKVAEESVRFLDGKPLHYPVNKSKNRSEIK
jgi:D-3-phosphoglycerate dehydrogenase / 2-oxoglutarate reductase